MSICGCILRRCVMGSLHVEMHQGKHMQPLVLACASALLAIGHSCGGAMKATTASRYAGAIIRDRRGGSSILLAIWASTDA